MKWPVGEQITLSKSTCSSLTSVLTCSVILICRIGSCMHQSSGDTAGRDSTRQRDDGVRDSHRCALHLLFCEVENNLFLFIRALAEFEPVVYARLRQADSTNSSLRDNCCSHCCCCYIRAGPHLMLFTAAAGCELATEYFKRGCAVGLLCSSCASVVAEEQCNDQEHPQCGRAQGARSHQFEIGWSQQTENTGVPTKRGGGTP